MAEDMKPSEPTGNAGEPQEQVERSLGANEVATQREGEDAAAEIVSTATDPARIEGEPGFPPDWEFWRQCRMYEAELREAVALSCNIEPRQLDMESEFNEGDLDEYSYRLDIATRAAESKAFPAQRVQREGREAFSVRLCDFVKWTLERRQQPESPWERLPPEFEELAVEEPPPLWPWGNYTTDLLDVLRAAVEEHWAKYNPEVVPEEEPESEVVVKFLLNRQGVNVSKRVADVMDSIIRHNKSKLVTHKGKPSPKGKPSDEKR